jgi:hypothetical protein
VKQLINTQFKFSLYENIFSVESPERDIDINQLIEIIKYGYLKTEIEAIRKITDDKKEYDRLKRSTLCYTKWQIRA